ncbi:hypothetical protein ABT095_33685 [Kitasatospora sp. NPDC002227]|uniref:hypothetical protein n=1 Tax=Kitasatospora sp. NPDC002227 TaxID=3154773 RepID=UPI00331D6406
MTDTATRDQEATAPAWLQAAEQEYARLGGPGRPGREELQRQADEVNNLLARLGITPITPARPGDGKLIAAQLLEHDADRELWGVDATHDGWNVVLEAMNWEDELDVSTGPVLTNLATVVHVHRHGDPQSKPRRSLHDEALHIADSLADDPHALGNPVAEQLRGLTLAVLHLAGAVVED